MIITELNNIHYNSVKNIYMEGIATGHATFQTEAPTWEEWNKGHLLHSRFIAIDNEVIMGWAALLPVSGRPVYDGVAEVSIYIGSAYRGKGIGNTLMNELISSSEQKGIWTLQAGVFPENKASLQLHENNGFRIIGKREKIGKMDNVWRDTVLLERRSKITGI